MCEWIIKSGHFRAAEYKATSKNFKRGRGSKTNTGNQPSHSHRHEHRDPYTPPALNHGFDDFAEAALQCADGFIGFCLICYIAIDLLTGYVAIDLLLAC
jgi:hypothetical protein